MEAVVSRPRSHTSWGAIFAGVFVALALQILLVMFGLAVGTAAIDPQSANPFSGIGVGSVIWLFISGIVSLFAGAFVTGRLSNPLSRTDGGLNGVVVWALFLIVGLFSAGQGVAGVVGGVFSTVKSGATAAVGSANPGVVEDILEQSGMTQAPQPQNGRQQLRPLTPQERDAASVIAKNSGLSMPEAENLVRRGQQQLGQIDLGEQARNVGGAVADVSSAAFFGLAIFFLLLLGASYLGGLVGVGAKHEEAVVV